MASVNQTYRIKPMFSLVAHSPDVVELRAGVWNPLSITLSDQTGSGKLYSMLKLLDGTQTTAQIAKEVGISIKDVKKVLAHLEQFDALETGPSSALDYYLSNLMGKTLFSEPNPAISASLTIMSDSELGLKVSSALEDVPGLSITVVSFDTKAGHILAERDFTITEDALNTLRMLGNVASCAKGVLAVVLETIHPIVLRNINRVALHLNIPWLHAVFDGPFILIGPTFIPARSPCYECFEARIGFNIRETKSYQAYKEALAEGRVQQGQLLLPRPLYGLLASLTSLEILNFLLTGTNFTIGRVLSIYVPTMEFSYNEFLRIPTCPGCCQTPERWEAQLHFDLQAYFNQTWREEKPTMSG